MIYFIDKPTGYTSLDCVAVVRRLLNTKKVGHTGTLDPLATGLLVVLTEESTKIAEYIKDSRKTYKAVIKLGLRTDTQDITGNILENKGFYGSFEDINGVLDYFRGEIFQLPPMYSAIKKNGVKLVDAARKGIEIERDERKITIFSIEAEKTEQNDEFNLTVDCSAGTYIRTICEDIGNKLGCGGTMKALRRIKVDDADISICHTLDELEKMSIEERKAVGLPTENVLKCYEKLKLTPFFERLFKNGCEIYQKKIGTSYPEGTLLRIYGENGFFALGRVKNYENGLAIKQEKRIFDF